MEFYSARAAKSAAPTKPKTPEETPAVRPAPLLEVVGAGEEEEPAGEVAGVVVWGAPVPVEDPVPEEAAGDPEVVVAAPPVLVAEPVWGRL